MDNKFEACTEDEVRDALSYVDGTRRDTWIQMGCAIKHEFGEAGFAIWDSWSATQDGYNKKSILADWKAIKAHNPRGSSVTIATLFKRAIDNGYQPKAVIDAQERKRLQEQAAERRKRSEAEAAQQAVYDLHLSFCAGNLAREVLKHTKPVGTSRYLGEKGVQAFGIHFSRYQMMAVLCWVNPAEPTFDLITEGEQINAFWKRWRAMSDEEKSHYSMRHIKHGMVIVPVHNEHGVCNLQLIYESGAKKFLRGGQKSGAWHLIGEVADTLLVAEGYATGATLHQASGLPVAVAFDAGNLLPVGKQLRALYPDALMMFCADDDAETAAAGKGNPGRDKAAVAAAAVGGFTVAPNFAVTEAVA